MPADVLKAECPETDDHVIAGLRITACASTPLQTAVRSLTLRPPCKLSPFDSPTLPSQPTSMFWPRSHGVRLDRHAQCSNAICGWPQVVLTKFKRGPKHKEQETLRTDAWPAKAIKQKWEAGMYISATAYGRTLH